MHIQDQFEDLARKGDGAFAIAYALLELANQQRRTAVGIERLGLGDAATPMGAIELLSKGLNDSGERIADAIRSLAPD